MADNILRKAVIFLEYEEYLDEEFEDEQLIDEDGHLVGGEEISDYEEPAAMRRGRGRPRKSGGMHYQTMIRYGDYHKHCLDSLSRGLGKSNNDILRAALTYYYNIMKDTYRLD